MDIEEPKTILIDKIIFKDLKYNNKEFEKEFNEKILKICDMGLSREEFSKRTKKLKEELLKKYIEN